MRELTRNGKLIEMQLREYLLETRQKGNVTLRIMLHYCIGYYKTIDEDILDALCNLDDEGWFVK